jgi:protein involved in polysaccharide export with SLBB domain
MLFLFLLIQSGFCQKIVDHRKVAAGDVLEIVFPSAAELSGRYEVDFEGRIFVSLIGYVDVNEKTVAEIRLILKQQLAEFVKYPDSMEIKIKEKKKLINVLGYIRKPGIVTVSEHASLQEVLFLAGDILPGALLNRVEIRRKNGNQIQNIGVLYNEFLLRGDANLLPVLKSGDIVFVPKGLKELNTGESLVYVFGAVARPGTYEITSKTTLLDALSHAGGTTSTANLKDLQIIKNAPGNERVIQVNLKHVVKQGEVDTLPLIENGDTVFVGEKKPHWLLTTIQIAASLLAIYSTVVLLQSR